MLLYVILVGFEVGSGSRLRAPVGDLLVRRVRRETCLRCSSLPFVEPAFARQSLMRLLQVKYGSLPQGRIIVLWECARALLGFLIFLVFVTQKSQFKKCLLTQKSQSKAYLNPEKPVRSSLCVAA